MSDEKKTETGFKISDRRISSKDEAEKERFLRQEETKSSESEVSPSGNNLDNTASSPEEPLPVLDFPSFILSLWTSALIQMGEIEDPIRRKKDKNLTAAKQTIDLIAMLQEKTKGNLSEQEQNIVTQVLYDLRMKYVKTVRG